MRLKEIKTEMLGLKVFLGARERESKRESIFVREKGKTLKREEKFSLDNLKKEKGTLFIYSYCIS